MRSYTLTKNILIDKGTVLLYYNIYNIFYAIIYLDILVHFRYGSQHFIHGILDNNNQLSDAAKGRQILRHGESGGYPRTQAGYRNERRRPGGRAARQDQTDVP